MPVTRHPAPRRIAIFLVSTLLPLAVAATPIALSNPGYWLETVGSNTILFNPGSAAGTPTTLFIADSSPNITGGTTAAAVQNGLPLGAVGVDGLLWARRVINPNATQLGPLTVNFSNGPDTASFTGRDLNGLNVMPLVQNLQIIDTGNARLPLISWVVPNAALTGDVDLIQLAFYDDDTNLAIGGRPILAANAGSFQITNLLPLNFHLTVNVRLVDLFNDADPFTNGNILRMSRSYGNYATPLATVPEPGGLALASLALGMLLGVRVKRERTGSNH